MRKDCKYGLILSMQEFDAKGKEIQAIIRDKLSSAPKLIPIYAHRYMPMINGDTYPITDKLTIECEDLGKSGVFKIYEYGINIKYKFSKYLDFDAWSQKEDVDIFFCLFSRYKKDHFMKCIRKMFLLEIYNCKR